MMGCTWDSLGLIVASSWAIFGVGWDDAKCLLQQRRAPAANKARPSGPESESLTPTAGEINLSVWLSRSSKVWRVLNSAWHADHVTRGNQRLQDQGCVYTTAQGTGVLQGLGKKLLDFSWNRC